MYRLILAIGILSSLSIVGCTNGPTESVSAALDGEPCRATSECDRDEYCTVDDGDCYSNCEPGENCPAVCWGVCRAKDRKVCTFSGDCGADEYCSVEDGDCFPACPPGNICPAVCTGYCLPKNVIGPGAG